MRSAHRLQLQLSGHVMTWHARLAHSPRAVQRRLERKRLLHPGSYLHCRGSNGGTQSAPCMQAYRAGQVRTHRETATAADMPAGRQAGNRRRKLSSSSACSPSTVRIWGTRVLTFLTGSQSARPCAGEEAAGTRGGAWDVRLERAPAAAVEGGALGQAAGGWWRLLGAAGCCSVHPPVPTLACARR